ncbi:MAG TPA: VTT domain-containing protein [Wenzhouxiangella sp.]|nr:VTT domain-containing protein [Wenzhouxiangella sp.]
MEQGLFNSFFQLIESHSGWIIAATFVIAMVESFAIVGIVVPGIVLLFLVGAAVGLDPQLFAWCWLAASSGAIVGDGSSYWLGRRFSRQVPAMWPLRRNPELLASGRQIFARHGGKSILIGRFIGPVRPVIPLLAGMMGFRAKDFLSYSIPAGIVWAPVALVPGMLFGASLSLAAEFAGRLVALLLIIVLGAWFVVWVTRVTYDFTAKRSGWWLRKAVRWANRHPVMGRVVGNLLEPGRGSVLSVALLGLVLGCCIVAFTSLLIIAPLTQPTWDLDQQLGSLAASLRSHFADPLFVAVSLAGEMEVLALLGGFVALVLLAVGRTHAAFHWAIAVAGGWLLAEMSAAAMGLILPGSEGQPGLAEVPHRAFVLATVTFGFFAVLLAKDLTARRRKWPYLATAVLLALIGFAHFYLGRASLIGLLAAFALGLGWVALVGIGYRSRALPRRWPVYLAVVFYSAFVAIATVEIEQQYAPLMSASQLQLPERQLSVSGWRQGDWRLLPEQRSRFGRPERKRFDLQIAGDLQVIARRLQVAGWRRARIASLGEALREMLSRSSNTGQPVHLPRDFAGLPERMILTRDEPDGTRLILRLWDSGARLGELPLWLGQVRVLNYERGAAGFERWQEQKAPTDQTMEHLLADVLAAGVNKPVGGPMLISLENPPQP